MAEQEWTRVNLADGSHVKFGRSLAAVMNVMAEAMARRQPLHLVGSGREIGLNPFSVTTFQACDPPPRGDVRAFRVV